VDDFTKLPAVCLIDEIDTYLHPKWQYSILDALVKAFPNVQFIVTTHSPYVVGSIPNDKIQ
jgi:predicted ATP-binding protein involved in virulence